MKSRIAVITERFPVSTEQFIYRGLAELSRKGVQLSLFCLRDGDGEAVPGCPACRRIPPLYTVQGLFGLAFYAVRRRKGFFRELWNTVFRSHSLFRDLSHFLYAAGFARCAEQSGEHVHLHAEFAGFPARIARIASRISGLNYTVSAHARDILVPDPDCRENLTQAQFVVFCTRAVEHKAVEYAPEIAKRTEVVYHGVPAPAEQPVHRQYDRSTVRIAAVGRFVEKKGFTYLIQACGILRDRGIDVLCTIAGSGAMKKEYMTFVRMLRLEDRIDFPGFLSAKEVQKLLCDSDLLCVPSVPARDGDMDGIPNVVLEAAREGIPAVASSLESISEAVTDGFNGLLVQPGSAESLAEGIGKYHSMSPEEKQNMSLRALSVVLEKFNVGTNMDQWIETFRKRGVRI